MNATRTLQTLLAVLTITAVAETTVIVQNPIRQNTATASASPTVASSPTLSSVATQNATQTLNTLHDGMPTDEAGKAALNFFYQKQLSVRPFTSVTELKQFAEGVCYVAITHKELCGKTPVKMANLPGAYAVTDLVLYSGKNKNRVNAVEVNWNILKETPSFAAFIFAHEWNHAEMATMSGNMEGYQAMEARANDLFMGLNGEKLGSKALEAETDCMTLYRSGFRWEGYGASPYLSSTRNRKTLLPKYVTEPYMICAGWQQVLYGGDGENVKSDVKK